MRDFFGQDWVSIVGGAVVLVIGWMVLKSLLHGGEAKRSTLHVTAFCLHCGWEGRVVRSAMRCSRCRSTNMSVVAT